MLKRSLQLIRPLIVFFFKLLLHPIVALMSIVIPRNEAYDIFSRYGYHLLRKHYYLPIPENEDNKYSQKTELVGIEIEPDKAFHLIQHDLKPYNDEFKTFPLHATAKANQYHILNNNYMAIDGNLYYSLIRHSRPKKIIEIGSGNSTLLAAAAIRKNKAESPEFRTELISIEPYPGSVMRQEIPELTQLIEKKVQDVDLSLFESLESGDILFIDSTHVLRSGGDVWWEFCEILPRLGAGVFVHIHDISLPKPYPEVYMKTHLYWNEQYLLQAFLTHNNRFEVIWPGNYLMINYPQKMQDIFAPEYNNMREMYPESEPSAFWMRTVNDSK